MTELDYDRLARAVREDAGLRRVRRLQPVGGPGDKIFPPTYPGDRPKAPPRHVFERRRVDGEDVLCVLVDSVQSQANRLEEALLAARDAGEVAFPAIAVDFADTAVADIGRITSLEAPHRVFDAIIRDSELEGKTFKETDHGRRLIEARTQDARALYELAPTSLVFGAWNSTGEGGGLGAKFPRAVVSEIVGVRVAVERDAEGKASGWRTGSRIDPLGIRSGIRVYKSPDGSWSFEKKAKAKEVKPAGVNHSNIPPTVEALGVSVDYAVHSFVLSFPALRRLRFGGGARSEADVAARTVLASLALVAALGQDRQGYFLRSRCDLVPEPGQAGGFELVHADGATEAVSLDYAAACALLGRAVEQAAAEGLEWRADDLVLRPQPKLVRLVQESREKALQGVEDEPEG